MTKYENLKKIYLKMKKEIYLKRPDCEELLNGKDLWTLNKSELNLSEELNVLIELKSEVNESFIRSMIRQKLLL